jgi:hypothetical protein
LDELSAVGTAAAMATVARAATKACPQSVELWLRLAALSHAETPVAGLFHTAREHVDVSQHVRLWQAELEHLLLSGDVVATETAFKVGLSAGLLVYSYHFDRRQARP